jgi:hypothetical protein
MHAHVTYTYIQDAGNAARKLNHLSTPWVTELPSSNPGAGNSNAIVSVGTEGRRKP